MLKHKQQSTFPAAFDMDHDGSQLNVPPAKAGGLWKVVVSNIKCPGCGSDQTKSKTGKRRNSQGLWEHYRECQDCELRFRVVFE